MAGKFLQSVFIADSQAADSWEGTMTGRKKYNPAGVIGKIGCPAASWLKRDSAWGHNRGGCGESKQSSGAGDQAALLSRAYSQRHT